MVEEELNQYVVFKLGDEEYGIDVMGVKEIAKPTAITGLPRAPSYIDGVFNLRGGITPLINLRKKFGFTPKEIDEKSRIVITELDDKYIGMLVDDASEVLGISTENIESTPELVTTDISKEYLKGVGKLKDRLIIILDLEEVLSKQDFDKTLEIDENVKKIQEILKGRDEKGKDVKKEETKTPEETNKEDIDKEPEQPDKQDMKDEETNKKDTEKKTKEELSDKTL